MIYISVSILVAITLLSVKFYRFRVAIKWLICDFSGLRLVWRKIRPPIDPQTNTRLPVSFFLWMIGTYVAFFGVASQRYEDRVDIIENRANAIFAQVSANTRMTLKRVPAVQNMPCPYKPNILSPITVFRSLFSENDRYYEMIIFLRDTVEDWKHFLEGANLLGADFQEINFWNTNLQGILLMNANLKGADLGEANLRNAKLTRANLEDASLWKADLKDADLKGANFQNADLRETQNLSFEQLAKVKTLYKAKLDPELEKKLKSKCPKLLMETNN